MFADGLRNIRLLSVMPSMEDTAAGDSGGYHKPRRTHFTWEISIFCYVFAMATLRPKKSYAERKYGVSRSELKAFAERTDAKIEKDRKSGRCKSFEVVID
jgi:hypothetical protein